MQLNCCKTAPNLLGFLFLILEVKAHSVSVNDLTDRMKQMGWRKRNRKRLERESFHSRVLTLCRFWPNNVLTNYRFPSYIKKNIVCPSYTYNTIGYFFIMIKSFFIAVNLFCLVLFFILPKNKIKNKTSKQSKNSWDLYFLLSFILL